MITFHVDDLPLVKKLKEILGNGIITKVKGVNAYRFTIQGIKNLIPLINLIKGKFRSPKIKALHNLIN